MQALVLDGAADLGDLRAREVPAPDPAPGRAIVEVAAAAVNRSDVLNAIGMMPATTFPRVPGRDFAGTVVNGPEELMGRRCWGTGGSTLGFGEDGTHAELVSVGVDALVPLPWTMTLQQAGAAGLSYLISSFGLDKAGLGDEAGQAVLVTGAAGGVGAAASAQALWRGARLIAAVRNHDERDAVLAQHPEAVAAVAGKEPLSEVVARETEGRGVDIVFDTVGNPVVADCIDCLAWGGRMVVITAVAAADVNLDLFGFFRRNAVLMAAHSSSADSAGAAEALRRLLPGFESGDLPPPRIAEEFALEECGLAYRAAQEGRPGRVLLRPGGPVTQHAIRTKEHSRDDTGSKKVEIR